MTYQLSVGLGLGDEKHEAWVKVTDTGAFVSSATTSVFKHCPVAVSHNRLDQKPPLDQTAPEKDGMLTQLTR